MYSSKYENKTALVCLSGGIDSTVCLAQAIARYGVHNVNCVGFYYGQKHKIELDRAKQIADYYSVPFEVIDLSPIYIKVNSPLLKNSDKEIPDKSYEQQVIENGQGAVATVVPNRNMLMISALGAYAGKFEDRVDIILGAQQGDSEDGCYPDCTREFFESCSRALSISTSFMCSLQFPLQGLDKSSVIKLGLLYKVPFELTYSCYRGGQKPCGHCATCIERQKAFDKVGVKDPALEN